MYRYDNDTIKMQDVTICENITGKIINVIVHSI